MNTQGFCESWNLSCISRRSSLPNSAYMWNVSTWSARYLVSYHFTWRTWPVREQNSTAFRGEGAPGSALSILSCSGRSVSLDSSSWSASGYSACSLTSIVRNGWLSKRKIGESTQVLSGHSSYNCPEMSFRSSVSPNTNENHASHHRCTLHAPEAPSEVCLSPRSSVLIACRHSTWDQWGVQAPLVSERVVFHSLVSILITWLSSKALQFVSRGAPCPVELLHLRSG